MLCSTHYSLPVQYWVAKALCMIPQTEKVQRHRGGRSWPNRGATAAVRGCLAGRSSSAFTAKPMRPRGQRSVRWPRSGPPTVGGIWDRPLRSKRTVCSPQAHTHAVVGHRCRPCKRPHALAGAFPRFKTRGNPECYRYSMFMVLTHRHTCLRCEPWSLSFALTRRIPRRRRRATPRSCPTCRCSSGRTRSPGLV